MRSQRLTVWCCCALIAAAAGPAAAWDVYANSRDGTAIPDVNKLDPNDLSDASCWQAAAANLLAAGGWGIGANQQDARSRAKHVYARLSNAWGTGAPGNVGNAMTWWLQNHGRNNASTDYDPNNSYTNVNMALRTLNCPDYRALLNGLGFQTPKYAAVLWRVDDDTNHWLTLVGGDYEQCDQITNSKQSVWHDSDRTNGGTPDDVYTSAFPPDATWDLFDYVVTDADEYDQLCLGLIVTGVQLAEYHVGRCCDPAGGGVALFCESGDKADDYDDPAFESDYVLRIDNEFDPNRQKQISLLIDYAGPANLAVEQQIYLLDDKNVHHDPLITHGPDDTQLLFEWLLDYQPAEERVVFPDDKYRTLVLDLLNGDDVVGWELTSYCVPEPMTLAFLLSGGVVLGVRRRKARR